MSSAEPGGTPGTWPPDWLDGCWFDVGVETDEAPAGYEVTARCRWVPEEEGSRLEIGPVTVEHSATGAAFTFEDAPANATAAIPLGVTPGALADAWREARQLATYARSQLGRPAGSPNRLRAELVAAVRADPSMATDEIDRRGVALGIWEDMPGDYDTIGKRVRRLRESAAQ